jgi:hypothetical protein
MLTQLRGFSQKGRACEKFGKYHFSSNENKSYLAMQNVIKVSGDDMILFDSPDYTVQISAKRLIDYYRNRPNPDDDIVSSFNIKTGEWDKRVSDPDEIDTSQ